MQAVAVLVQAGLVHRLSCAGPALLPGCLPDFFLSLTPPLLQNCSGTNLSNPLLGAGTAGYLSPGVQAPLQPWRHRDRLAAWPLPDLGSARHGFPATSPSPPLRLPSPSLPAVPCGKFFRFTWWITWWVPSPERTRVSRAAHEPRAPHAPCLPAAGGAGWPRSAPLGQRLCRSLAGSAVPPSPLPSCHPPYINNLQVPLRNGYPRRHLRRRPGLPHL